MVVSVAGAVGDGEIVVDVDLAAEDSGVRFDTEVGSVAVGAVGELQDKIIISVIRPATVSRILLDPIWFSIFNDRVKRY